MGEGNLEGTAVRPLRKAGENLATIDTVAVDETLEKVDEMITEKVEEEQGDEDEEGQQPKVMGSPKAPTKAERERSMKPPICHSDLGARTALEDEAETNLINDRQLIQGLMRGRYQRYLWTISL